MLVYDYLLSAPVAQTAELERARNMNKTTGNEGQALPKKQDPNLPDGGAVIKA